MTLITILPYHFQWGRVRALCKRVNEFVGINRKDYLDQIAAAQDD